MKFITFLFTVFFWFNAVAVAPYGFKGQQQSQTLYSNVLQGQNNLVTNMGGINALLETGNKNILTNPSFEHATFSTGWTNSAGTFTQDTSVEIDGLKAASLVLSSQSMALHQDSTLYASQYADGVQGLASVRVKTSVSGIKVCSRQAGVTVTSLCVDVQANGKWGLYKVPFILGATSNGISINSNGTSVTGTVYIDDSFVGAVDLQADVDASKIAGESYFAGTASCNWPRSTTTLGAFTATAACPGPTIVSSTMGQWQTTDSDLPRQTINNLPAGNYKATFIVSTNTSAGGQPTLTINDGTTSCESILPHNGSAQNALSTISCSFSYNSTGNRSFELFGSSTTGSLNITNSLVSPRASTKFILEYFGSSSVYSSTNADFWGKTYSPAITTDSGALSNFTSTATYGRQGNRLYVKGRITFTGASSAFTCPRIGLPESLTLATSDSEIIGDAMFLDFSATRYVKMDTNALVGLTNSVRISYPVTNAGTNPQSLNYSCPSATDPVAIASGDYFDYSFEVPVNEWTQSNIIIGQFNGLESCTSTLECTDTFSAKISSAGVVSDENVNWINGNATVSGGASNVYALALNSGIFTVTPNCAFVHAGNNSLVHTVLVSSTSSTVTVASSRTDTGAGFAGAFQIICQKQGVDYVGKTAKAVASDQNTRSIGVTKSVIQSCKINNNGTATVDNSSTLCGWVSSVSRTSTGNVTVNVNSGIFANPPICTLTAQSLINVIPQRVQSTSASSIQAVFIVPNTSALADVDFVISCHGVSP